MKHPTLFDVPKDSPSRKAMLKAFCKANGIWTHCAPPDVPDRWTALLLPGNPHKIELPYGDEETDPMTLISKWVVSLEATGFIHYGPMEENAVESLCRYVGIPFTLNLERADGE